MLARQIGCSGLRLDLTVHTPDSHYDKVIMFRRLPQATKGVFEMLPATSGARIEL